MSGIIYLDNAATTNPKPGCVLRAVEKAILECSGNPGRGSHPVAVRASELVFDTRETVARMFGASEENVVFTPGATYALNYAIKGLSKVGCLILIDNYAHNASYRPSLALAKNGICRLKVYDASGSDETTAENVRRLIEDENTIVIATHQSNISSKVLPVRRIGEICAQASCKFIVDAAQSAGHIPIDIVRDNITSLCIPSHKGLYGIAGAGMLISARGTEYRTLIEGGAGISSLDEDMPAILPERLEAGTLPLPAIASIKAGCEFVSAVGMSTISRYESHLAGRFVNGISRNGRVRLRGDCSGSVISFTVDGISSAEVGEWLADRGICVRTGYHCAPLAHKTLGTYDTGSVRIGVSYFTASEDIDRTVYALDLLCRTK